MSARFISYSLGCALAAGCTSPDDALLLQSSPRCSSGSHRATWPRVEPAPDGRFSVTRNALKQSNVSSVALGDCNDDGLLDVVALGQQLSAALLVGRGGGRFEPAPDALPRIGAMTGVFADLDGDEREDLVLVGQAVSVLPGMGGCRFGAPVNVASSEDSLQVLVTDANLDGRADLSIVQKNSADAPHRLLLARGDGTFDEFAPRPSPLFPQQRHGSYIGFGMFYEDLDGDGAMDLFALLDQRQSWFSWGAQPGEISQSPDPALGSLLATSDAMGVSPLDFDRDGAIDWFVSGIHSRSRLLRTTGSRCLDNVADAAGVAGVGSDFAWGSYSFDADLDGWLDLLVLRQGPEMGPDVRPEPGPVDLFLNRHDGTFASAGDAAIGQSFRAKGLACGPLSVDGTVGCFAMDLDGPALMVDGLRPRGRSGLLRLRGTVSAFDATGARVSVEGAAPPLVLVAGGQSPYGGEHARVMRVPLGDHETALVTIQWPSGIRQRGVTVTAGRLTVAHEPAAVTLSRRVVAADGESAVEVTVDPRALGAATATIERAGRGRWGGEATVDALGVHRVLLAPSQPGEARITVSLDGRALRVLPRVVFAPRIP